MESSRQHRDRAPVLRRVKDRLMALGGRSRAQDAPPATPASAPVRVEPPARVPRAVRSRHAPGPAAERTPRLDELRAEERYQRERLTLYRRKRLLGRPTTDSHLRELERLLASARARVRRAGEKRDERRS